MELQEYPIHDSRSLDHYINLSINLYRMQRRDVAKLMLFAAQFFSIMDAAGTCLYALGDVDDVRGTQAGLYYTSRQSIQQRIPRQINLHCWEWSTPEQRRSRVRGVYWGNYLNPAVVAKLGGPDSFGRMDALGSEGRTLQFDPERSEMLRLYPSGAAHLILSESITEAMLRPPEPAVMIGLHQNAIWLHRRLARADLLL